MLQLNSEQSNSQVLKIALKQIISYVKPLSSISIEHLNNLQVLAEVLWQAYQRNLFIDVEELKLLTRCLLYIANAFKEMEYVKLPFIQQLVSQQLGIIITQLLQKSQNDEMLANKIRRLEARWKGLIAVQNSQKESEIKILARPQKKSLADFPQLLSSLSLHHEHLNLEKEAKKQKVCNDISQLEAQFLYSRCGQALLDKLQEQKNQSSKNSKILDNAHHLATLLEQSIPELALNYYGKLCLLHDEASDLRNYLHRIGELTLRLQIGTEQSPPRIKPDWLRYREKLTEYREKLGLVLTGTHSHTEALQALTQFNDDIKTFIGQLLQEAQSMLCFPDTIAFYVPLLGSLADNRTSAYSDTEYGAFLEKPSDANWEEANCKGTSEQQRAFWLKTLFEIFEFKIRSLGEDGKGFQIDDEFQPRTQLLLRGTPENLLAACQSDGVEAHDGVVYALLHASPFYGDNTLYQRFVTARLRVLQTITPRIEGRKVSWGQYWGLAQMQQHGQKYQNYLQTKNDQLDVCSVQSLPGLFNLNSFYERVDLKKPFLQLLIFFSKDIALFHRSISEFDPILSDRIEKFIQYLMIERSRLHLLRGRQDDTPEKDHWKVLNEVDQELLHPIYSALATLWQLNTEHPNMFWQTLDWSDLKKKNYLVELFKIQSHRIIVLKNCNLHEQDIMELIQNSPNLESITLMFCPNLSEKFFNYLKEFPNLKSIICKDLRNLTKIELSKNFSQLQELEFIDCANLAQLQGISKLQQLCYFYINNCPKLILSANVLKRHSSHYNTRAIESYDHQHYEEVIADFSKAIALDPQQASFVYFQRGHAYFKLKRYEEALADHDKFIELNPEDSAAYQRRSRIYIYLNRYKKAILDLTKAVELNPKQQDQILYKINKIEEAIRKSCQEKNENLPPSILIAESMSPLFINSNESQRELVSTQDEVQAPHTSSQLI